MALFRFAKFTRKMLSRTPRSAWLCGFHGIVILLASCSTTFAAPQKSAELLLAKTVSSTASCPGAELLTVLPGTTVTFCYVVTNTGTASAAVIVSDGSATMLVGELKPLQSRTVSRAVAVSTDSDTLAVAIGEVPSSKQIVRSAPDGAIVRIAHPALELQKTVSATGVCPGVELVSALAGTSAAYCYFVTNSGNTKIDTITVSDGSRTLTVGTLDVGQSGMASTLFIVTSDEITAAIASGFATAFNLAVSSVPDSAAIQAVRPALSTMTTVSTNGVCPGQEVVNVLAGTPVTACYSVTNTGNADLTGVTVNDAQLGGISNTIALLQPAQSAFVSKTFIATVDQTLTGFAAATVPITGTNVQSPQDSAVINVAQPAIDLDVTISPDGVCPGSDSLSVETGSSIFLCYALTNVGDDTLSAIKIYDQHNVQIGQVTSLAPGVSSTLVGPAIVVEGDITSSATVNATDPFGFQASDTDTALIHALHASLSLQKTISISG